MTMAKSAITTKNPSITLPLFLTGRAALLALRRVALVRPVASDRDGPCGSAGSVVTGFCPNFLTTSEN
jgi:hypothetical protein